MDMGCSVAVRVFISISIYRSEWSVFLFTIDKMSVACWPNLLTSVSCRFMAAGLTRRGHVFIRTETYQAACLPAEALVCSTALLTPEFCATQCLAKYGIRWSSYLTAYFFSSSSAVPVIVLMCGLLYLSSFCCYCLFYSNSLSEHHSPLIFVFEEKEHSHTWN